MRQPLHTLQLQIQRILLLLDSLDLHLFFEYLLNKLLDLRLKLHDIQFQILVLVGQSLHLRLFSFLLSDLMLLLLLLMIQLL